MTMYAVLQIDEHGRPAPVQQAEVVGQLGEALDDRDGRPGGRSTYRVFQLTPVSDDGEWEWGVRPRSGLEVVPYVNRQAAGRCAFIDKGKVMRRRPGQTEWQDVPNA